MIGLIASLFVRGARGSGINMNGHSAFVLVTIFSKTASVSVIALGAWLYIHGHSTIAKVIIAAGILHLLFGGYSYTHKEEE